MKSREFGILMRRNEDARSCVDFLRNRGIEAVPLKDLKDKGRLQHGIRVGTFDRCKGPEFRAVFIPRLGASQFPGPPRGESGDTKEESSFGNTGGGEVQWTPEKRNTGNSCLTGCMLA